MKKRPSSAARLRAILDQAPLGIALTDSLTGRIQDVNPSFATITGRKRKDLLGLAWMDFTHPDDLQADHDQMARLIAGEIPYFQMDKRYLRPDGEEIWIGMTVAPVTEAGAPRRHISMIQDITAAKQMQAAGRRLACGRLASAGHGGQPFGRAVPPTATAPGCHERPR